MIDVTCALIIQNQKILVAQNNPTSDQAGKWEFPGGKIKPNETDEECIVREILEEMELSVFVSRKLEEVTYDYGHKAIRLIPFICKIEGGKIVLNDHQAIKWLSWEELDDVDFSAADRTLLNNKSNADFLMKYFRE